MAVGAGYRDEAPCLLRTARAHGFQDTLVGSRFGDFTGLGVSTDGRGRLACRCGLGLSAPVHLLASLKASEACCVKDFSSKEHLLHG